MAKKDLMEEAARRGVHAVDAVVKLVWNTGPLYLMREVYGNDQCEEYLTEKSELCQRSFTAWWGVLDDEHRMRLVKWALRKGLGL